MTLPQQTWRFSQNYLISPAGANCTAAEIIAAIKTMLDDQVANFGGLWMANAYSNAAANGYLEIRRAGTQSGILGTLRTLIFGGTSAAHTNAIGGDSPLTAGGIWAGHAENAGTTGPAADWAAGDPYPSHRWTGGGRVCTASSFTSVNSPFVCLAECDRMCFIFFADNTGWSHVQTGETIERLDATGGNAEWVTFTGGERVSSSSDWTNVDAGASAATRIPILYSQTSGSYGITAGYGYAASDQRRVFGRSSMFPTTSSSQGPEWGEGNNFALLHSVPLSRRRRNVGEQGALYATMRQVKVGPRGTGKMQMTDGTATQVALFFNGATTYGRGLFLDQRA